MCGASSSENNIAKEQQQNFQTMAGEASQVFGNSSQIFNDLTSAFQPVLNAGPGQSGYPPAELAGLRSQAITNSGTQYRNAAQAAGERSDAAGGGNVLLPSGTEAAVQGNIAEAGAANTANQLTGINIQNAEVGRQNWLNAAGVLAGAPNVFNPATSFAGATTNAGNSAMSGANTVQQANRQWVGDVTGLLGDAASIGSKFITPGFGGGGGGSAPVPQGSAMGGAGLDSGF